jgi:hypothetical protein
VGPTCQTTSPFFFPGTKIPPEAVSSPINSPLKSHSLSALIDAYPRPIKPSPHPLPLPFRFSARAAAKTAESLAGDPLACGLFRSIPTGLGNPVLPLLSYPFSPSPAPTLTPLTSSIPQRIDDAIYSRTSPLPRAPPSVPSSRSRDSPRTPSSPSTPTRRADHRPALLRPWKPLHRRRRPPPVRLAGFARRKPSLTVSCPPLLCDPSDLNPVVHNRPLNRSVTAKSEPLRYH